MFKAIRDYWANGVRGGEANPLHVMVSKIAMPVWMANSEGEFDYANESFCDAVNLPIGTQWTPETWQYIVHQDDYDQMRGKWLRSLVHRSPFSATVRLKRGATTWVFLKAGPVYDGSNNVKGWFGLCLDAEQVGKDFEEILRMPRVLSGKGQA